MTEFLKPLLAEWPVLVAALSGFIISFITYLAAKNRYKSKALEVELQKVELEKMIIDGSYVICPSCQAKLFLKDLKVFTGGNYGKNDEK